MKNLNKNKSVALITGAAGFIGFHISQILLNEGWKIIGLDCLNDYYDVSLKKDREKILMKNVNYHSINEKIENLNNLLTIFKNYKPEVVIHLAAQAGVRNSIENPKVYLDSNILGTFQLLEVAKCFSPKHILIASTSSVYGSNPKIPYKETDKSDNQLSFYAASKKSVENIAHSYSHLFKLPITIFRFFTVYGPWGRPDMAYYKFTNQIIKRLEIDVYNYGDMKRDYTYIDDLVNAINLLIPIVPEINGKRISKNDSLSPTCPFRVVNIGNSDPVKLLDFVNAIEKHVGIKANKNMLPMQLGDVHSTWASVDLLNELTGLEFKTNIDHGIKKFVEWYRKYHKV